jgi:subtilisin family serine protease
MSLAKFAVVAAALLGACARTPATSPAPAPTPTPSTPMPPVVIREAPQNWHLLDAASDNIPGISLLKAERELLANRRPARTVLVAVIDNGVDTAHAALRSRLWMNPGETAGNGRDDDNNGYVDDVYGWNLIGGRDGRNVEKDTYEVARLAALCSDSARKRTMTALYRDRCPDIMKDLNDRRQQAQQVLNQVRQIDMVLSQIMPYLRRATASDTPSLAKVQALQTSNDTVRQARQIFLNLAQNGISPKDVEEAKKVYTGQLEYSFNPDYDPRPIVGDSYPDTTVKRYGNKDVTGPGGNHGTHVAGIIGAIRDAGGLGIGQSVKIMAVRAVPDGDERDKDVALAIRYAVDNGAQVINMSFGKGFSPYKSFVDDAVKYADSKGVLMVHGAGNDGENVDSTDNYPSPVYLSGGRARHWIEVGASSWKSRDSLVAEFSNYGKVGVDIFAPGVDIYSTVNGGWEKQSGTSMASPVVAGLAAMLLSYYPTLTAADVKRVILESATPMKDLVVVRPGAGDVKVPFGDLSSTGAIVNAYRAVRMAEDLARTRP